MYFNRRTFGLTTYIRRTLFSTASSSSGDSSHRLHQQQTDKLEQEAQIAFSGLQENGLIRGPFALRSTAPPNSRIVDSYEPPMSITNV